MVLTENTQNALANLLDAFMAERGCSRLNAAGYAVQATVDEYNRISQSLGTRSPLTTVAKGYLDELEKK